MCTDTFGSRADPVVLKILPSEYSISSWSVRFVTESPDGLTRHGRAGWSPLAWVDLNEGYLNAAPKRCSHLAMLDNRLGMIRYHPSCQSWLLADCLAINAGTGC